MFVSGWKSSYIIALSGAVIINGEVAVLAWRLYTDVYAVIKDNAILLLLFDNINIKILPLYVWCTIYVLIIAGSIWGITYIVREDGKVKKAALLESRSKMIKPYDAERDITPEIVGEPEWKHEYSKIFYSGFRIKASAGRELTRGEILEIGKVVLNNQTLSRQLYVLGWDTLEVIDMKTSKGCRWALKEFVKLGLMIDFGNNGFLNK